jgi:hypothetical protein
MTRRIVLKLVALVSAFSPLAHSMGIPSKPQPRDPAVLRVVAYVLIYRRAFHVGPGRRHLIDSSRDPLAKYVHNELVYADEYTGPWEWLVRDKELLQAVDQFTIPALERLQRGPLSAREG